MNLSVVIPLYNEEESLEELFLWIKKVCDEQRYTFEVLFIDDGSTDSSWLVIEDLKSKFAEVKGIKFRRNYGKSAALHVGFAATKGDVVITMDADLQDKPDEIPELYNMINVEGYDLVSGWKKKRYDPLAKTLPSKFFNSTARFVSGIKLHDFNCGLKSYKGELVKSIEVYGEMHRYIPLLAKQNGFSKIGEKVVVHQERKYGVSKFGMDRFIKGFLDLLSVSFIAKFGKRPMHLFGGIGTFMFFIGFLSALYLGCSKLYFLYHNVPQPLVSSSPWFYISLTSMVIGVQMFLTGFIAELSSRNNPNRNNYKIEKDI